MKKLLSILILTTTLSLVGCSNQPSKEDQSKYKEELNKYSSIIDKDYNFLSNDEKLIVWDLEKDIKNDNLSDTFMSKHKDYVDELKKMRQSTPEEEMLYELLLMSGHHYNELSASQSLTLTQLEVKIADDNLSDEFKTKFNDKYKSEFDRLISEKNTPNIGETDNSNDDTSNNIDNNSTTQEPVIIERENIIGKSNKDFSTIDSSTPGTVRNDKTGNWRLMRIATSEDITEYAKSYTKMNIKNSNEIHAIVNFTLNTTTCISMLDNNIVTVTIHEYVKNEELDASKLFSGMVLADYWIYLDNGDIEKIE